MQGNTIQMESDFESVIGKFDIWGQNKVKYSNALNSMSKTIGTYYRVSKCKCTCL